MKKLVNINTEEILMQSEQEITLGGLWGDLIASGNALWLDVPTGEDPLDVDYSPTPSPNLIVNVSRKSARAASQTATTTRKVRLATHNANAATNVPELRAIVQDLLDEIRD